MKFKAVVAMLGCAVLFATLAIPAGAAAMPRQRSFSAAFQFMSQAQVSDATCIGGQAIVITGRGLGHVFTCCNSAPPS